MVMLIRTDPFRELDRLNQQVPGTATRPAAMPMDAYRSGDSFYIHFDLPGVRPELITLTVEHNVLTVRAERFPEEADGTEMIVIERPSGAFSRQVFLGNALDTDRITADYTAGVLTLTIPVRESAKPHSIPVKSGS
jgi:HSP20 family protein